MVLTAEIRNHAQTEKERDSAIRDVVRLREVLVGLLAPHKVLVETAHYEDEDVL